MQKVGTVDLSHDQQGTNRLLSLPFPSILESLVPTSFRALLIVAAFGVATAANAANLVSLRAAEVVPPAFVPDRFVSVSGSVVAVKGVDLFRLDDARTSWRPLDWRLPGTLLGSISGGGEEWLLLELPAEGGAIRLSLPPETTVEGPTSSPNLPMKLREVQGAVLRGVPNVFGVSPDGNLHWLTLAAPGSHWSVQDAGPLSAGVLTSVVAQDGSLFATLREPDAKADQLWRWTPGADWRRVGELAGRVVMGTARAVGQAHVLYLTQAYSAGRAAPAQLQTYHSITAAFANQGTVSAEAVTRGVPLGDGVMWEARALTLTEIVGSKQLLRPLDWLMIIAYLVAIAGIGVYCFRREAKNSTSEFFVGSRTIPFWAAAVSLYVTSTSSIGYIATTAKAFATNWQYLLGNITTAFGLLFVAVWIVPMLRRLRLVSVFDYLEQRFHPSVRMLASAMCILLHLGGRMSIILFLPALAIATITGLDVVWSILIMGVVTMGYTALGGMRAVIWTDFLQLIVKIGGLVFALAFIWAQLDSDVATTIAAASDAGKTKLVDWRFDLTQATVWAFLFVVLMETVLTFPKDQVLMQRVFTTRSDKEAGRSVWVFAAIIIPGAWLFYLIGTGLWTYYQQNPERMNPLLSVDATFPLFIAAELPAGVTGLMIAGIFAASMATCSSIMNSVATMVSVDFYERLAGRPTQRFSIRLAEWVTVAAGMVGIGLALLLSRYDIGSFLDVALELYGLLGGGFGGAYTLGMFSRRANWQGVLIGMVASTVLTFAAWAVDLVHPFVYLGLSILMSILFGYVGSLFFPPPRQEALEGLVITR